MAKPLRLVILHEGDNPTLGYFGVSIESVYPDLSVLRVDISKKPEDVPLASGDVVVIVRYLNSAWRNVLQARKSDLAGLVYFMDDDLFDSSAIVALPESYTRKLKKKALNHRTWLERSCSELWVGAKALAEKYTDLCPRLLSPTPPKFHTPSLEPICVAYHGSASHGVELTWLQQVIMQILQRDSNIYVEIFGDISVSRSYRHLPRVSVIQAMPWKNYLAYTSVRSVDIFLVPLIKSPFNIGRSYTKFFDAARLGAVGLYTRASPYIDFVHDGEDGILLENEIDAWVTTIVSLSRDSKRRVRLANNCRIRSVALGQH